MENASHQQMVSLIWSIADDGLRDVFLRGQYRDVILPMIVLRRLDALLEPTKDSVEESIREEGKVDADILCDITGLPYFNSSKWTLKRLQAQFTALKIDALRHDAKDMELSKYLYAAYGEKLYTGLDASDITAVKEYLQENECANVANNQSQCPIGTGNIEIGNTSTLATFGNLSDFRV